MTESRKKIHGNAFTAKILASVMEARRWSQRRLAKESKLAPSVVSEQLAGRRAVRDDHLQRYLNGLTPADRRRMLAAWIADSFEPGVAEDLLAGTGDERRRLRAGVRNWLPGLSVEQQQLLQWLGDEAIRDTETYKILRTLSFRLGFRPDPAAVNRS